MLTVPYTKVNNATTLQKNQQQSVGAYCAGEWQGQGTVYTVSRRSNQSNGLEQRRHPRVARQRRWIVDTAEKSINYIIVYNGGAYGNFVGWCIEWLTDKVSLNSKPWGIAGNSHNNNIKYYHSIDEACNSKVSGIVHPIKHHNNDLNNAIIRLLSCYSKVVLLYPELDNFIWNINNKFEKIFNEGWIKANQHYASRNLVNWSENPADWQKREWMSYTLHKQHYSEVRYDVIKKLNCNRIKKISLTELRDDFFNTVYQLGNFLEIEILRSKEQIQNLHNEWLSLQIHKDKDRLINHSVNAIVNKDHISFDKSMTLIDEAEIQRRLREDYNMHIKCYNLDNWPDTSTELQKLLYKELNQ